MFVLYLSNLTITCIQFIVSTTNKKSIFVKNMLASTFFVGEGVITLTKSYSLIKIHLNITFNIDLPGLEKNA